MGVASFTDDTAIIKTFEQLAKIFQVLSECGEHSIL